MNLVDIINNIFSILSILAQGISVVLLISLFSRPLRDSAFVSFFAIHSILVGFVASALAMAGSLTYSDVVGYAPCVLCWFQRIFMYPQVILLGLALYRRDLSMRLYAIVLSSVGGALALWHYLGQLGFGTLPCSALGYSVSCAERFVMQYGYVTIPMMALSAFVLIALSSAVSLRKDRDNIIQN